MQKLNFSTSIKAPKEKVWTTLWDDDSYRNWTRVFCEGSHAVTDWNEGSKVLFLSGDGSGMVSKVAANRPNEYMSFRHLGIVKNGVEDTDSEEVKAWAGALENYTLQEDGPVTTLRVDMDIADEHKDYFVQTWPKALERVKEASEVQKQVQKITPFLWFNGRAEEAVNFYTSLFKNSKIGNITRYGDAGPGPKGTVIAAAFQLDGQEFIALNGGPQFKFTEAVSFVVNCETQEEVDAFWEQLSEGGEEGRCGWLKDKFGLSWQIVPAALSRLLGSEDAGKANNVMQAMLQMNKMDVHMLQQAYNQP